MLKRLAYSVITVLIIWSQTINVLHASHLIGGNLGYEYLGQFGNLYRYRIILTTYTDCTSASQIPQPESPIQPVGVYQHNVQNDPMGGGNKTFLTSVNLTLTNPGGTIIQPSLPGGCNVGAGSCITKGVYTGVVDLPLSFNGYHVFYERCCRNAAITNLVPNESMSFHAYIPSSLVPNNSPKFTDDPIPFLCAGETTTILNTAYDEDGDLLTFNFVHPYDGFSNATNPAPGPPNPAITWPLPTVTYAGGFSTPLPFGASGSSSINASTGLTVYAPPAVGNYVVAIEIREFRNGNLIGVTRRDLQLLVINCPANPAPVLSSALGTTTTQFNVEEGATLCFNYGYSDPNNNNVTLVSAGAIFNPAITSPAATVTTPVSGSTNAATQFCWTTACGQARTLPYQFQTSATDDGCPPKTANNVFQITVNPVAPPTAITGTQVSCQFATQTYSTNLIAGASYNWSITGGTILSQNNNQVTVQWNNIGANSLSVSATNQFGCSSAPIDYEIVVTAAPTVNAGNDVALCIGSQTQLTGSTSANPGYTINWTPVGIVSGGTTLTPTVAPTNTTDYVLTINIGNGCFGRDTVRVTINDPQVDAGSNVEICSGESTQLNATATSGTLLWSPSAGLNNVTIPNPIATPTSTTTYTVQLTDALGCIATDNVTVSVAPVVNLTVSPDATVCEGNCITLTANGATTYLWSPSLGLSSTTSSTPQACPLNTQTYQVIGFNNFCTDTAFVTLTVPPAIQADAGTDVSLCLGESTQLNGSGATHYSWSPAIGLNNNNIANPIASPTVSTTYTLTITDDFGCIDTDQIVVTVNPLPTAHAGEDKGICISTSNGASIPSETLNGSGNGIPSWSPSIGLSDPSIFNPIINPDTDTEYVLTVTSPFGCINRDTVFVQVFDAVPTFAGDSAFICPGESVVIGGNPSALGANTTYLWSPSIYLDNASLPNPTATPDVSRWFYLVTNNDTCNGIDSVYITVRTPPTIVASSDVTICNGNSTQLNASGGVSYLWNNSTSLNNISIANPIASPTSTTTYTVTGTDVFGCSNTDEVMVTVNSLPTISAGTNAPICAGNSIQLNATGGVNYSWSPINTLDDPALSNPVATPSSTTTYTVVGTDANLCSASATVIITVNPLPNVLISGANAVCIGNSTTLTASGASNYVWTAHPTLSNVSIPNPVATPTVTTTYEVTGTDANSCVNSTTFEVAVNLLPTISAGNPATICQGQSTGLQASGGVSYVWNNGAWLSNTGISNPTATPPSTTTFTVVGTDQNGCENTDNVTITVNNLPLVGAGSNASICQGGNIGLLATGAVNYLWSPGSSLDNSNLANPNATPTTTTTYTVLGTDANNCQNTASVTITVNNLPNVNAGNDLSMCIGGTTQLNATGASIYTWSPSTGLSSTTIANPQSTAVSTILYTVTGTDGNGCSNSDEILLTVNPLPTINTSPNDQICIGDSIQLTASGAINYQWSPTANVSNPTVSNPYVRPTATTVYTAIGTDGNGCSNSATIEIIVNPLPSVDAGNNINSCRGDDVQLSASGAVTYSWSPSTFLNNTTIPNPIASPDTTTLYYVTGVDVNGCINSDSVLVTIFRINVIPDETICEGESVQLNVFGSPGNSFVWSPSTGLSNPTIANPIASPTSTTTYSVSASDMAGCNDQDSVTILVNPAPNAQLTYEVVAACTGGYVNFYNNSSGGTSYFWQFGDGDTSSLENPVHIYPYSGSYNGTLQVVSEFGCSNDVEFNLETLGFNDYFNIYIPNVFTPNGDGENDLYKVIVPGRIAECVSLSIYNRWGQLIFISTANNLTWDGYTSVGQPVPNGTYMYIIEVADKSYSGTISLFR
jgi:gliding motility-associated-like protein